MNMCRRIKNLSIRIFVLVLIVSNVFFGLPIDTFITAINNQIQNSLIVDQLYLALNDQNVVDRNTLRLPTTVKEAHAATTSVQMAERFIGSRSNTTTNISNYTFTWTAPAGITALTVEARGGGGGGGGSNGTDGGGGGGGGGGGYAISDNVTATAGSAYTLSIGRGGTGGGATATGGAGTNSSFSASVVADAGNGGGAGPNGSAGTAGTVNTGGTTFNGGAGSAGVASANSGAGGGGAGDTENGSNASGITGGNGGTSGGGSGANGINTGAVGLSATNEFGAGGGGGYRTTTTSRAGGAGSGGVLNLNYTYDADDAFPIIRGVSGSRSRNVNSTSHSIELPPGIEVGELIVVVFSIDGAATVSVNTGVSGSNWNKLGQASNGTTATGAVFWKVAEGSDILTLTTGSEQSSYLVYRIDNHSGTVTGTSSNGSGVNSDPAEHTPAGGADNYLWLTTRSSDAAVTATVPPTDYIFWRQADSPGSGGAATDVAVKFSNASSEDPGTWTSTTEQWVSWTLAIPVAESSVSLPTVTTQNPSSITSSSMTLNGNITDDGGASSTIRGFAWGTNSSLSGGDTATTTESGAFGTSAFTTNLTSLDPNTTYYSRAYAVNSAGTSTGSILSTTTLPSTPGTPTFADVTVTTMTVNWTTPTGGATTYKLESCDGDGCSDWTELDAGIGSTTYADSALSANTLYRYRVRATNATGDSSYSSIGQQLTLPATAGNPSYGTISANTVDVSWSAPSGGAASYQLAECYSSGCRSLSVEGTSTTTSLIGNTSYSYAVRAVNDAGNGAWSATTTVLTLPAAPGTPTFEDVTITTLTANWSAPTGGASTYKLERCAGGGCSDWTEIASSIGSPTYDDSTLSSNTLYRYRVRATNATGDGSYSSIGEISTSSEPPSGIERLTRIRGGITLRGGIRLR